MLASPDDGLREGRVIPAQRPTVRAAGVLPALADHASGHGLGDLAGRLDSLHAFLGGELAAIEHALQTLPRTTVAHRAGGHLLAAGGKRVRPLCVLLAAGVGPEGRTAQARKKAQDLAVAVELVHAATLLHDDVVDLGEVRRGQPAPRMLHGNEVSIFAGDWLLVEALRRIHDTHLPDLVLQALETIEAMILAEVEQIERARDRRDDVDGYLRVIDGKTAALFRWALKAGARAGGCDPAVEAALVAYGTSVGLAFQLVDDVLDLSGDPAQTGKDALADLAEGKITLPLALLIERKPSARAWLDELRQEHPVHLRGSIDRATADDGAWATARIARLQAALSETGALRDARNQAIAHVEQARAVLGSLRSACPEVAALDALAGALAARHV